MMQNDVHNEMAKFAYDQVSDYCRDPKANQKEFRSLARSFPSMVQANGLGAAVAFLFAKKSGDGGTHASMYGIMAKWLKQKKLCDSELMACITGLSSQDYRLYTNEIMALCLWLKRFAEGMIEKNG